MSAKKASAGETDVRPAPNLPHPFQIFYRTEADMRASLAELAAFYGWDVEQEVVIPGWGRVDLVLRQDKGAKPYLIELKLVLKKPSEVRRAFQQADGYGRWWTREHGEANTPIVVAEAPDMSVITPVADTYPAVPFRTTYGFMHGLRKWHPVRARFDRSRDYTEMLREQLANYERAHEDLTNIVRGADEAVAHTEYAAWIAAGEPTLFPKDVDF